MAKDSTHLFIFRCILILFLSSFLAACGSSSEDDSVELPITLVFPENTDLERDSTLTFMLRDAIVETENEPPGTDQNPALVEWQTNISGKLHQRRLVFRIPRDLISPEGDFSVSVIVRENTEHGPENYVAVKQYTYEQLIAPTNSDLKMIGFVESTDEQTAMGSLLMRDYFLESIGSRTLSPFPSRIVFFS